MLNAVLVLTRARLLIAKNTFWRGSVGQKIGVVVILGFVALAAFGLYTVMGVAVRGISSPQFAAILEEANRQDPTIPTDIAPFLETLPSLVLFGALFVLIFTSFSTVLSSLYLSGDIDTLLVAPVPMRAVFIVKFFGGLLIPYALLFVLLGPALLGYGQGLGYGVPYYLTTLVVLLLLPLLPAGLGALLVMAVVRVIPARRARDIVSVLGGLLGILWFALSQFSFQIAPRISSVDTLDTLRQVNVPVLPTAWAGRALTAAGEGEWLTLLAFGGLFSALSIGVFVACLFVAERLYYAGWANMATQGGRIKKRSRDQRTTERRALPVLGTLFAFLPEQSRAILYKDLRVFPRDLRNLQQLIWPLVIAAIWAFNLVSGRGPTGTDEQSEIARTFGLLGSAGISFFICLSISSALAGPGISREGRSFWMLKIAPVSGWHLLLGKLILAYLPFPLVGTLFVGILAVLQGMTASEFLFAWVLVLIIGLGTSSITLGWGAAFPKFDWDGPQQQTTLRAGCLSFFSYTAYVVVAVAIAIGLPALAAFAPQFGVLLSLTSWILLLGLTTLVVWLSMSIGSSRLERIEVT